MVSLKDRHRHVLCLRCTKHFNFLVSVCSRNLLTIVQTTSYVNNCHSVTRRQSGFHAEDPPRRLFWNLETSRDFRQQSNNISCIQDERKNKQSSEVQIFLKGELLRSQDLKNRKAKNRVIVTKDVRRRMSGQTNSLTSPPQETSSSHTKTLETRRGADTPPRTQTEGCDDEDDCGSSKNYDNNGFNDMNTANRDTASTSEHARSCEVSDVHKDYIENNRNIIENKCKKFYTCTKELYKTETLSRILEGGDIQLHNICGVLTQYKDDQHATETNTCWPGAREFLKQELEEELKTKIEKYNDDYGPDDDDEPTWQNLANCLNNTVELDRLCRIQVEQPLCNSVEIESKTEKLFNTRLRTLHCYCEALSPGLSPDRSALIGGTCGGVLAVMMLLVVIAVLYIRKRKRKSRLQSEAQRSANVTSPSDDTLSTYEIVDDHFQGPNSWSERIKSWHSMDQATPGLPPRDLPYQPPHTTSSGDHHSEDSAPDIVFLSPRQGLPAPRTSSTSGGQGSLQDRLYELAVPLTTCLPDERKASPGSSSGGHEGPFQKEEYSKIDHTSLTRFKEHGDYFKLSFRLLSNNMAAEEIGDELQLPVSLSTSLEKDEEQKQSTSSLYKDSWITTL